MPCHCELSSRPDRRSLLAQMLRFCVELRPGLVQKKKIRLHPSHQMFRHIQRVLNVDQKINCTVLQEIARQIF
jgi:hypothetical protein